MKAFSYFQLVWMFYGRQTNARINHICERVVYNNEISPLEELLGRDKSESMPHRNIKILAAELFKLKMIFRVISSLNWSVKEIV